MRTEVVSPNNGVRIPSDHPVSRDDLSLRVSPRHGNPQYTGLFAGHLEDCSWPFCDAQSRAAARWTCYEALVLLRRISRFGPVPGSRLPFVCSSSRISRRSVSVWRTHIDARFAT